MVQHAKPILCRRGTNWGNVFGRNEIFPKPKLASPLPRISLRIKSVCAHYQCFCGSFLPLSPSNAKTILRRYVCTLLSQCAGARLLKWHETPTFLVYPLVEGQIIRYCVISSWLNQWLHLNAVPMYTPTSDVWIFVAFLMAQSLTLAKDAIKLDVSDGASWFVLGNAYLAIFFSKMENIEHIRQALKAYKQAEKDTNQAANNPDLHQNRATIHKFLEEYGSAIEGYQMAALLDPDWPEPRSCLESLVSKLKRTVDLIRKKCHVCSCLQFTDRCQQHTISIFDFQRLALLTIFPIHYDCSSWAPFGVSLDNIMLMFITTNVKLTSDLMSRELLIISGLNRLLLKPSQWINGWEILTKVYLEKVFFIAQCVLSAKPLSQMENIIADPHNLHLEMTPALM